jgi:hypothetical protein
VTSFIGDAAPARSERTVDGAGAGRAFRIVSTWRVDGDLATVTDVLSDAESLPRWWSSSFLRAEILDAGDADWIGRVVRLHSKGVMPHTLQFMLRVDAIRKGRFVRFDVRGDFVGIASIAVRPCEPVVELDFMWDVTVRHPVLAPLVGFGRWLFVRNHRWAMAGGERCLQRELDRRRGEPVPAAPRPVFPHSLPWLVRRARWRPIVSSWPG